jgi:predicted transcriptional regulator
MKISAYTKRLGETRLQKYPKTGTSQPAIARLESGKYQNVSMSFLRKVGKALNVIPEIYFKKAE